MLDNFGAKLLNAIDWAGKCMSLALVIGFILWQAGAFPFIGNIVENEFRKADLLEQVEANSLFRDCWPTGTCEGIAGLPVDDDQNRSIVNIAEAVNKLHRNAVQRCQADRDSGDTAVDCTEINLTLKIYVD